MGSLARAKARSAPSPIAAQRSGSVVPPVAMSTAARSFAVSLLDTSAPGVDGDVPSMQDVLSEGRYFL